MKQEDKELLLKDLCARLPYGFFVHRYSDNTDIRIDNISTFGHFLEYSEGEDFKPYLRPMSSMTEEERKEWEKTFDTVYDYAPGENEDDDNIVGWHDELGVESYDWLNSHYFDYRELIDKDLALEAPEGMYN